MVSMPAVKRYIQEYLETAIPLGTWSPGDQKCIEVTVFLGFSQYLLKTFWKCIDDTEGR